MESNFKTLLDFSPDGSAFALLDPVGVENLYARLEGIGDEFTALANGSSAVSFARVSPFVARISHNRRWHSLFNEAVRCKSLIWVISDSSLEKIRSRLFAFYCYRRDKTNVYMRIVNADLFVALLGALNPQQSLFLGRRVSRFIVPKESHDETQIFSFEKESFQYKEQLFSSVVGG